MSVSPLTASASSVYQTQDSSKPKSGLDVAAQLFGMSKSDLADELKSGKSLDDVAEEKGVSTEDLDSALVKNMPSSLSGSGDATAIAQKIASQVGLPPRQGAGGPGSDAGASASGSLGGASANSSSSVLDELSKLLNTDSTTLKDSLSSGTSLADLLSQSGVSLSSLADTLQQGMLVDTSA